MTDSEKMNAIGWIPIHEACDYEYLVERLTPLNQQKSSDQRLINLTRKQIYKLDLKYERLDESTFYRLDDIPGDALQTNFKIIISDDFIPICVRLKDRYENTKDDSAFIQLFVKSEEDYKIITSIIVNIQKSGIIEWKIVDQDDSYIKDYHHFYTDGIPKTRIENIYQYFLWDIYCKFVYLVDGNDTRFIDIWERHFFISPYNYEAKSDEEGNSYYSNYLTEIRDNTTKFLTKSELSLKKARLDLYDAISDIAPNDKQMNMTPQLFDMSNSPYYPFSEYNTTTKEAVRYIQLYNRFQIRYTALFKKIGDTESYYKLIETVSRLLEETLKIYDEYLKKENDFQKRLNLALNIDSFNSSKKMENLTYIMVLIGFGTMAIQIIANFSHDYLFEGILLLNESEGVTQNMSYFLLRIIEAGTDLGFLQLPIIIILLAISLWVIFCKNRHI